MITLKIIAWFFSTTSCQAVSNELETMPTYSICSTIVNQFLRLQITNQVRELFYSIRHTWFSIQKSNNLAYTSTNKLWCIENCFLHRFHSAVEFKAMIVFIFRLTPSLCLRKHIIQILMLIEIWHLTYLYMKNTHAYFGCISQWLVNLQGTKRFVD